ncbi:hypothetical protein K1X84_15465 [bacterium]|nr:hypothetical protein [bacterium]
MALMFKCSLIFLVFFIPGCQEDDIDPVFESITLLHEDTDRISFISFDPSETHLLMIKKEDLYSLDIPSGILTRLTYSGHIKSGRYSPDGKKIVYLLLRDTLPEPFYTPYDFRGANLIFVMSADGSNPIQITPEQETIYYVNDIHPISQTICYISYQSFRNFSTYKSYLIEIDGSNNRLLTNQDSWFFTGNGEHVMVGNTDSVLNLTTLDGTFVKNLVTDVRVMGISADRNSFVYLKNGIHKFFFENGSTELLWDFDPQSYYFWKSPADNFLLIVSYDMKRMYWGDMSTHTFRPISPNLQFCFTHDDSKYVFVEFTPDSLYTVNLATTRISY